MNNNDKQIEKEITVLEPIVIQKIIDFYNIDKYDDNSNNNTINLNNTFLNVEMLENYISNEIQDIIYSDLSGNDLSSNNILENTSIPCVVSGGVSNLDDLIKLKAKDNNQIYGVIIGKALYDKSIKLNDALSVTK